MADQALRSPRERAGTQEEKKRKAAEWYEQQMAAGDLANPNLLPLNKPSLMPLNTAPPGSSAGGFAVPAVPRAKQASWRDRLAGKAGGS